MLSWKLEYTWHFTELFVSFTLLVYIGTYHLVYADFSMSTVCMLDSGHLKPEYELCLDCKLQAGERILHQCHSDGHKPVTVLYVDEESREIVPVPLPRGIGKMSRARKFRAHLPSECRNPQYCSFPHHQLAAKIMNQWKERTVTVSKPPTLVSRTIYIQ